VRSHFKELIERTSKSISTENSLRSGIVTEGAEVEGLHPLGQLIKRVLGQGEVDGEPEDEIGPGKGLAVGAGDVLQKDFAQTHSPGNGSDERQGPHVKTRELSRQSS